MRGRFALLAVGLGLGAGAVAACSVIFTLDGFDQGGAGGSNGDAGPDANGADAGDAGDVMDANGDGPDAYADAGFCVGRTDGTTCAAAKDGCHGPSTCHDGGCVDGPTLPESTNWDTSNPQARCCGGVPVVADTNENCNVCGIKCNTGKGQSCQQQGGAPPRFQCTNCVLNMDCWSGCCATKPGPAAVCADSDCNGNCPTTNICPAGAHCEMHYLAEGKSNVCVY